MYIRKVGCKKLIRAFAINYYASNKLILIGKLTNQLFQLIAIILFNIKMVLTWISGANRPKTFGDFGDVLISKMRNEAA